MTTPADSRISDAVLDEIEAGLEGVTPGPWFTTGSPWFVSQDGVLAGSPDGNISFLIADCEDTFSSREEYEGPFPIGDKDADAAHIARLDPDTIRALITELRERRAQAEFIETRNESAGFTEYVLEDETTVSRPVSGELLMSLDRTRIVGFRAYDAPPAQAAGVTEAACDVLAERKQQVEAEGWTAEHDDGHRHGEMAGAAACYALAHVPHWFAATAIESLWPWDNKWWKPTSDARRGLVKAGALILAEIERLDRLSAQDREE